MIHVTANGYNAVAADYHRGRPRYDLNAVSLLVQHALARSGTESGGECVEIAAGSGIFTEELRRALPSAYRLTAVEPVAGMREHMASILPDIPLIDATAQQTPFADSSVTAIFAATAFHWFAERATLDEWYRILRPTTGAIALIFNTRVNRVERIEEIIESAFASDRTTPRTVNLNVREWFQRNSDGRFTELQYAGVSGYRQVGDVSVMTARYMSISAIASKTPEQQNAIGSELITAITQQPVVGQTESGDALYAIEYRSDLYWCYKI